MSFIREGLYVNLSVEEKGMIHTNILNWICNMSQEAIQSIPNYVKTKYAVLIALLIKMDYPTYWPEVFDVGYALFVAL